MYLSDYTIPEAEVIYQKAIIRGGWWFLAFIVCCVLIYAVVYKIVEDRKDIRSHKRRMAREKSSVLIGQASFDVAKANQGHIIWMMRREIDKKDRHIEQLEKTMRDLHFGDVAEKIRKENEDGTNESEDRS